MFKNFTLRRLKRGNLDEARAALEGMDDTSSVLYVLAARGHVGLFKDALVRAKKVPSSLMSSVIRNPELLRLALSRGLDPNAKVDSLLATEAAARKHLYPSLRELFAHNETTVTRYVVNRLKSNAEMYALALKRAPVERNDVFFAMQTRSTPLLQRALMRLGADNEDLDMNISLEDKSLKDLSDAQWAKKIYDKLQCPILCNVTAEPVRTPQDHIYDMSSIYTWIDKHGTNPLTREPLSKEDLKPVGATILSDFF